MSITQKSGNFASDVISREQNNIKSQAAIIKLAQESIAKSEARIKQWAMRDGEGKPVRTNGGACYCSAGCSECGCSL